MSLSLDELTARVARCIGVWETNRGGEQPAPRESSLDTVAGVHASMATIEQATMPYALGALHQHPDLCSGATPPLTKTEIDDALAACQAVVSLLELVAGAAAASVSPTTFVAQNATVVAKAHVDPEDVVTMFAAVALRATIGRLHAEVEAGTKTLDQAVASVLPGSRLGLGPGSVKSYIRKPANWGENRAGWQRKAVNGMGNVGQRIAALAAANGGMTFALPVIRQRIAAQLAKVPRLDNRSIVRAVATQNNPGEANYGDNVWDTYHRLFP